MTPERLQEIRDRAADPLVLVLRSTADPEDKRIAEYTNGVTEALADLLDYIDLLHEDLALTRQERDHAKHQALEHRKARAQAEDERDAYRRGQGPAPTPATPGTTALHETHPIPNSRGDDQ